jgi:hypothetical protein
MLLHRLVINKQFYEQCVFVGGGGECVCVSLSVRVFKVCE